jgi:hypothetical protein
MGKTCPSFPSFRMRLSGNLTLSQCSQPRIFLFPAPKDTGTCLEVSLVVTTLGSSYTAGMEVGSGWKPEMRLNIL